MEIITLIIGLIVGLAIAGLFLKKRISDAENIAKSNAQVELALLNERLEATSPKNAWYELELVELLEGFAVIKRSGQQSAKGVEDAWFRRTRGAQ